jgi:hypothetical protein
MDWSTNLNSSSAVLPNKSVKRHGESRMSPDTAAQPVAPPDASPASRFAPVLWCTGEFGR